MTEEPTKPSQGGNTGPIAGERLAGARLAREISLDEIARELHLDESKVRALEQNAFEHLGAPVFVKGYLRKYAILVGVSGDDVVADYERLNHSTTAPPLIGLRPPPSIGISPGPWLAGAAVIAVVVLAAWWFWSSDIDLFDGGTAPEELSPAAEQREVPDVVDAEPSLEVPEQEPLAVETTPEQEDAGATSPSPALPEGQQAGDYDDGEPAAGETRLQLTYSGDCWTEVTDVDGNRLYFGLGTDGRTVAVSGSPPLEVLLGDSENVRVEVDGVPYAIPGSARRGDTARFTISP